MTDERPLIEGVDAYHESLKEGARRERERILKLINEKLAQLETSYEQTQILLALKKELKK